MALVLKSGLKRILAGIIKEVRYVPFLSYSHFFLTFLKWKTLYLYGKSEYIYTYSCYRLNQSICSNFELISTQKYHCGDLIQFFTFTILKISTFCVANTDKAWLFSKLYREIKLVTLLIYKFQYDQLYPIFCQRGLTNKQFAKKSI